MAGTRTGNAHLAAQQGNRQYPEKQALEDAQAIERIGVTLIPAESKTTRVLKAACQTYGTKHAKHPDQGRKGNLRYSGLTTFGVAGDLGPCEPTIGSGENSQQH